MTPASPLAQPYEAYERPGLVLSYSLDRTRIVKGSLVGLTLDGRIAPMASDDGMRFLGVSTETADPELKVRIVHLAKAGTFVYRAVDGWQPSLRDVGAPVYAISDWEVALEPGPIAAPPVGTVVFPEKTHCDRRGVRIRIDLYVV